LESLKKVSGERTERLAWLAKIELTEAEKTEFTEQLNRILEFFRSLDALDLEGVEPTYHVLEITNSVREDARRPCLRREEALAAASKVKDGYFVAPKVV